MFTNAELLEQLSHAANLPARNVEVTEFDQQDFDPPESEQTIEIHCGKKADFEDALHFWLKSLQSQDWNSGDYSVNYAKSSLCLPLAEERFMELIADYSRSSKKPLDLAARGKFQSGMQMHDEWNDVALLAEFEEEYIAFYWATTA